MVFAKKADCQFYPIVGQAHEDLRSELRRSNEETLFQHAESSLREVGNLDRLFFGGGEQYLLRCIPIILVGDR